MKDNRTETEECARIFLKWLNQDRRIKHGYILIDALKQFPMLQGELRWDYSVRRRYRSAFWALELKEPITPEENIYLKFWEDVCLKVTNKIKRRVKSTFYMYTPPNLNIKQYDKQLLIGSISEIIIKMDTNSNLICGVDIWPKIRSKISYKLVRNNGYAELPVGSSKTGLRLEKKMIGGSQVKLVMHSSPSISKEKQQKAVENIFSVNNNKIQADSQLKTAKQKGAKKGILILNATDTDRPLIKNTLNKIGIKLMSNIDSIYLVDSYTEQVIKMWPTAGKYFRKTV